MKTPFHFNLVTFLIVVVKRISNSGSPFMGIFFSYKFKNFVLERLLMGKWGTRRRMEGTRCRAFYKISQIKSTGDTLRYLRCYYPMVSIDTQRAFKNQ